MDSNEQSGKPEPRQVIYAELHQQIFLPGLGQLPKSMDTSPSSQQTKLRGLKMWISELGIEIDLRSRRGIIPMANVAFAVTSLPDKATAKELDKNVPKGNAGAQSASITKVGTATITPSFGPAK